MAKFSIIIPIYNSEQFLKRCLDSVLAQTFEDFQVICIDDGSTDNSFNVLTRYKLKDKRIKVISQENCGQGSARNKGIEYVLNNSMSEYIYFLDSDDYIEQDLLESAWETFSTTDTDLICFNTEVVGDESSRLYRRARKYAQLSLVGLLNFTDNIKDLTNVYVWNKVFKTEIIKNYDIRFAGKLCYEDIAFCKMYFLVSDKIYFDMRRFHHYMIREGSLMDLNFKSEIVALDHFRNWYEIFKMAVKNKEVFEAKKTIIEKWFWDYYFMTKSMVKTSGLMELEKLKAEYFKEFDKA